MAIVSTMILRSMRLIGEKARGATLDTSEQTETLAEFNTFLDSLPNERLYAYTVEQASVAMSVSTSTYTIGPGGNINVTPRPVKLVDPCFVRDSSGFDTPVKLINVESYGGIVDKDAGYTVPTYAYYDTGFSATSTGTISVYPVPSGSLTLFVNFWRTLGRVANLSTDLALPPGYQLFLESNFAIHLAAGLTPVPAETAKMARESKASIKGANLPEPVMRLDMYRSRGGNIFTGD